MSIRRHRPLNQTLEPAQSWKRRVLGGLILPFLGLAALLTQSCTAGPAPESMGSPPLVEYVGTYVWHIDEADFGGFSGIHIKDGGKGFTVLSDRATLRWGRIERDADGLITGITAKGHARIKDSQGRELAPGGLKGDSEGLAIGPDGRIWISFEGLSRVVSHDSPDSPAKPLPRPREFKSLQRNSSLETLAVQPDGTVLTVPERSGAKERPFPVWRFRNGKWDQPFSIPRRGDFLAVDADIGPDGRFYLLERDFLGLLGFRSRVRRFDLDATGLSNEQVLFTSYPLQYDNLEGIAVWSDGKDTRLTMISDDNFGTLQRTELIEYRLKEQETLAQDR